jgi:predicted Zn-dependent protease
VITFYEPRTEATGEVSTALAAITRAGRPRPVDMTGTRSARFSIRAAAVFVIVACIVAVIAVQVTAALSVRCAPITWSFDAANAPSGAHREVVRAWAEVHAATGITFSETPHGKVTIAWASRENAAARWAPAQVGRSNKIWRWNDDVAHLTNAKVLIRTDLGSRYQPVLLHELGHVVGLDHSRDPRDVMYPVYDRRSDPHRSYSARDLARLHAVGAAAGCFRD